MSNHLIFDNWIIREKMNRYRMLFVTMIILLLLQGCRESDSISNFVGKTLDSDTAPQLSSDPRETLKDTSYQGVTGDGMFEYKIIEGEAEVIRFLADCSQIIIPDKIDGYPVTSIGDGAFYQKFECRSVLLPQTLRHIKTAAFYRCCNLDEIIIPASVIYIASDAFFRTENLRGIFVDKGNRKYCDVDGILFSKDQKVLICYPEGQKSEEYKIPDGVNKIESHAFGYYPSIGRLIVKNTNVFFPEQPFTVFTNALTIVAEKASTAELYANRWGFPFEKE